MIPSLCSYLQKDKHSLRLSIFLGTGLTLAIYLVWQYLFIGAVPAAILEETLAEGAIATEALHKATGISHHFIVASFFAFFALSTSLLGVSFSMIDFFADGFALINQKPKRITLCLLTFLPPMLFTLWNPAIFDAALGVAGGIGEAFLNGLLPVALVFVGRYRHKIASGYRVFGGKWLLYTLLLISSFVMLIECYLIF